MLDSHRERNQNFRIGGMEDVPPSAPTSRFWGAFISGSAQAKAPPTTFTDGSAGVAQWESAAFQVSESEPVTSRSRVRPPPSAFRL